MSTYVQIEKLSGVVERVTFHSLETGWSVLKVTPFNDPARLATVLIHQAKVFAGASMEFHGSWTVHQKFGDQFKATKVIERKPASAAALEKYLGSGLIKGVGPKTAHKIVKHFGERTLGVFEDSINELVDVPSIAEKKLAQIKSSWEEHRSIRDVMMFLQSHGVSTLFAVKIFKKYGNKAIELVSKNPYCLARDIYGIGFFSADHIALSLGFKRDGEERIQAGIKHILASSRDNGHCYLVKDQILEGTLKLLELEEENLITSSLDNLLVAGEIMKRRLPKEDALVDCYYSKTLYWDEEYVVKRVHEFIQKPIAIDSERAESWIKRYCEKFDVSLSDEQAESVLSIVQKSFSILTGGPGCGKTTTTKVLVKLLQAMHKKILLVAPTGRAAQRMTEVIGKEAKTIHRLLEWEPQKGGFKKGEEEQLKADFLIVDECSMLDINLAASLLKAVPINCQILFIGDPDQLPSVGAGAVLQNLLAGQSVPSFRLTKVFRQAQESLIIKYAHQINKGDVPKITSPLADPGVWQKPVDCIFIDSEEANQEQLKFIGRAKRAITQTLEDGEAHYLQTGKDMTGQMNEVDGGIQVDKLYIPDIEEGENINAPVLTIPEKFKHVNLEQLSKTSNDLDELKEVIKKLHPWSSLNYGLTALDSILRLYTNSIRKKLGKNCEIQILTPQVRGSLGTVNLNKNIQEKVNPIREGNIQIKVGERFFRVNDRVIQTKNNYDLNVFNGDIGKIIKIDPEDYSSEIRFGDQSKTVIYKKEDLTELNLAYAITIHKSQGSEFEAVIIPVTTQHFKMLFRNLIYTGLTRAKKLAVFVGSRKALTMAIKSIDNRKRQTAVEYLLSEKDKKIQS
jgi:exodeoxyribonuclease V alpha subunit